jgi:hypothetical protein
LGGAFYSGARTIKLPAWVIYAMVQ